MSKKEEEGSGKKDGSVEVLEEWAIDKKGFYT
jgi:hypothetical protein